MRAVAASRYFSILATATGEIWSFGGGFNGELGFRNTSWVTSAQKVEGQLAQVPYLFTSFIIIHHQHTALHASRLMVWCNIPSQVGCYIKP